MPQGKPLKFTKPQGFPITSGQSVQVLAENSTRQALSIQNPSSNPVLLMLDEDARPEDCNILQPGQWVVWDTVVPTNSIHARLQGGTNARLIVSEA